jgi:uncharacterized membrane protein
MAGRTVLSIMFMAAGLLHFLKPQMYVAIMPAYFPAPLGLVYVSGVFEILGGVGLLAPADIAGVPVRRIGAWGLVALLIAVMPANINMVVEHERFASIPQWALWARLPLQLPMIWWAWLYTRNGR